MTEQAKRRCVVIGGAPIADPHWVRGYLHSDDFIIYCDCGLRHREALGAPAHLVVGDFDSHPVPDFPVETISLPREKDDTDSFFAVKEGLRRGYEDFLLLGVFGARLDHSLANISILLMLDSLGKSALAVDDYSEICVVSRQTAEIAPSFPYFSLVAVDGRADEIRITGAKFPLEQGSVTPDYQYAVSNEPLPGQTARVQVGSGRLLLLRDRV